MTWNNSSLVVTFNELMKSTVMVRTVKLEFVFLSLNKYLYTFPNHWINNYRKVKYQVLLFFTT